MNGHRVDSESCGDGVGGVMDVFGPDGKVHELRDMRCQLLVEHQVFDARLTDHVGVVVVGCVAEGPKLLVALPLPLLVNALGDEV